MFVYYNANPNHERIGDCVIRAISVALNKDYYDILYELFNISNYFNCDMIVKDCYDKLLSGYYNLKKYSGMNKTVEQVANDFYDKTLIIRIDSHLTVSVNSIIKDIWDCSNEIVDCFWIVE